jgi:methylthioribose-1-phosphate isomerase
MKVEGTHRHSIEPLIGSRTVQIIDQTLLPHQICWRTLATVDDAADAISQMLVRGAPLIGATAAYGYALAAQQDASPARLAAAYDQLLATRPTAVNLRWALDRMRAKVAPLPQGESADAAWNEALKISADDIVANATLGRHGLELLRQLCAAKSGDPLNIMTHCNAGWLACVDGGTALAPIYHAHDAGLPVHVWVSETRPRNQGASLTAWELRQHGVPHTLIVDNEAGHLLQRGLVDACIVGADRVAANGDVANKIGTYMKALAASAHDVPFFVAMPTSTIDWTLSDGIRDIPIEQRSPREVTHLVGLGIDGQRHEILVAPEGTPARNDSFDVTPARLVTAFITELGICAADTAALQHLAARHQ